MAQKADWGVNENKVSDRMKEMFGKKVKVITTFSLNFQTMGEEFTAILLDLLPLGKEYFFRFVQDGQERFVRTPSVVEIQEI